MRRALLLGAAGLALAAGAAAAVILPAATVDGDTREPRITRIFIPAIKYACRERAGIPGFELGYTFDADGALQTIDTTGLLTGLPEDTLAELNRCLAEYPILPPQELPRGDRYERNLLYDYFSQSLRPCLEARVAEELPALPTRADFVERLYAWDPYRALVPGRGLEELLRLAVECPDLPPYLEPA